MRALDPATSRLLSDARRICAVPAPLLGEGPRGELLATLLAQAGARPRTDAAGNVIASFGPPGQPLAVLAAHLDTVFDAGTPIEFSERDDRLIAPGIGDNSLGVAALVHIARLLAAGPVAHAVAVVGTVGEEGLGDLRGAKALLEELDCRAFVAVEGQMLDTIKVAAVGSIRVRLTITGPGGHPWNDRDHPSAVHALVARLATAIDELREPELAINVGVASGGSAINVIADRASADIDLRCEDERQLGTAAGRLREILLADAPPLLASIEQLGHRPGGRIADDHPLLLAARRARAAAGLAPAREGASSTDANAAHGRGIPAITVGVSTGGNAHRLDDYVDIAPIGAGLRALEELARQLASDPAL